MGNITGLWSNSYTTSPFWGSSIAESCPAQRRLPFKSSQHYVFRLILFSRIVIPRSKAPRGGRYSPHSRSVAKDLMYPFQKATFWSLHSLRRNAWTRAHSVSDLKTATWQSALLIKSGCPHSQPTSSVPNSGTEMEGSSLIGRAHLFILLRDFLFLFFCLLL